jgi:hypothetical protein
VLVAAAQHDHPTLARAVSGWLVTPDSVPALAAAGAGLARCMSARGLALPDRARRGAQALTPAPSLLIH